MWSQDKVDGDRERLEIHISILSLRGENKVKDAAIHRISRDAVDLSLRFLATSRSPRAFSPRDDKSEGGV